MSFSSAVSSACISLCQAELVELDIVSAMMMRFLASGRGMDWMLDLVMAVASWLSIFFDSRRLLSFAFSMRLNTRSVRFLDGMVLGVRCEEFEGG